MDGREEDRIDSQGNIRVGKDARLGVSAGIINQHLLLNKQNNVREVRPRTAKSFLAVRAE